MATIFKKHRFKNFTYQIVFQEIAITRYTGSESNLEIPQYIKGIPVNIILPKAFLGCNNLTSVTIPENIEFLNAKIFVDCLNLKNIKIPESIIEIGFPLFSNCPNLKTIEFPYIKKKLSTLQRFLNIHSEWIKYYGGASQIFQKIDKLKRLSNFSFNNTCRLNQIELLLKSDDYSDKLDNNVSNSLDDILRKQSITNLITLFNNLNGDLNINWNFNTSINKNLIELLNRIQR